MLLMENVLLAVVPVGEAGHVGTHLHNWLGLINRWIFLRVLRVTFLASIRNIVCRLQVHIVRVDNLGLFLQIECFLMILNIGVRQFVEIVRSVVGEEHLRIGVLNESVSASSVACALVTDRQLVEWSSGMPNAFQVFFSFGLSTNILAKLSVRIKTRNCS